MLLMPFAFSLDAIPTYVNITGNTTDLKITSEEGSSKAITINSSYVDYFSFVIYRNNSLQDDYDSLYKEFNNLSGSYSFLVANINTSCIYNYNYTFINSSVNLSYNYNNITNTTYVYYNNNGTNYTCAKGEDTNTDFFKAYSLAYINSSALNTLLINCQSQLDALKGDSSCQDKLTNCQNLLGAYSGSGTNCGAELKSCLDQNKTCTTEGWKIPTTFIIGLVIGGIIVYSFLFFRNPKNKGRGPGSDTMTKPFIPT